jgi:two-component system, cell cycle response regulator DivK
MLRYLQNVQRVDTAPQLDVLRAPRFLQSSSQADQPGDRTPEDPAASVDPSKRLHSVLIIDDDDDNLLFAQYAVEYLGYRATAVTSGAEAVAASLSDCPDVILLDIVLKVGSGFDVLQQLRSQPHLVDVPIVAVTALVQPSDRAKITAAGFSDYLAKPYMLEDLDAMISHHLPV